MSTTQEIDAQISKQGDVVRQMKADKAEKSELDTQIALLTKLKADKAALTGQDASTGSKSKKGKQQIQLKVPKGTKDHLPHEMLLRNQIFKTITNIFERHGGVTIDTPVFELKEILSGKYGEDSKLIYDLQDQGGELCSLRYDLTVPFARFLAMNGSTYQSIKRYHIAKVYRRDNPAMTKGRMREFYQCDFDIAGNYDAMVPDAECLKIACEVLEGLQIGDFTIKVNHRKVLDGIFTVCGVPEDKVRTISSAVDKLDKSPWSEVRKEMTEEKGLSGDVADQIGEYVKLKGQQDLLDRLLKDEKLTANKTAKEGLDDMATFLKYLTIFGVLPRISFDLSLARGLDYYTGVIYECITEASAPPGFAASSATPAAAPTPALTPKSKSKKEDEVDESQVGVGSIAAGGRYDNLVGMFAAAASTSKNKDAGKIPCVGISFGVERIFSILQQKAMKETDQKMKTKEVDVFVMAIGGGLLEERMQVASQLWDAGIRTEYSYKAKPKAAAQWEAIDRDAIPFVVIVGADEIKQGKVLVKEQVGKEAADGRGEPVEVQQLVAYLKERLPTRL